MAGSAASVVQTLQGAHATVEVLCFGRSGVSTSAPDRPRAASVEFKDDQLVVRLEDGRTIMVPLEWFPRLRDATDAQLADFRLVGQGIGIHWPQLDEDLSVRGLLLPEAADATFRRSA